ncbi:MAG: O-antigen ligase family protein, partial [Candidatus Saccharicenans sp.]
VCLLPLPFGGNVEWAIFIFESLTLFLFIIYVFNELKTQPNLSEHPYQPRVLTRPITFLLLIFFILSLVQLIPESSTVIRLLSPRAFFWRQSLLTGGLFESSAFKLQTLSLSAWASAYELVKYLSYAVFVFLLSKTLNSRKRIKSFCLVLIGAGIFQSLYGLSEFFSGHNRIFTWVNRYYAGSAFGTFVNRDHYSAFLEMIFPLSLGYFLVRSDYFSLKPHLTLRQKIARFGQENVQKSLLFILPPFIIGIGLFYARCRSGIIIFIITFFLALILLSLTSISGRRATEKRLVKIVILIVLLAVILIGVEPILERFAYGGFLDKNRLLFYSYTIHLIRDYPLFGCGLGTYAQAINFYLQKDFYVIVSHAHNDYLEMLAESGLIAGISIILAGFLAFALAIKRWLKCQDPLAKGIGLGASLGILALLFHSLTDFSLRMPGNALAWLSLFALALKAPLETEKKDRRVS